MSQEETNGSGVAGVDKVERISDDHRDSQRSLASRDASQISRDSQHSHSQASQASQRSRTSTHDTAEGGGAFFADMMLDLSEAQLETTPRTDSKFANMANARRVREELAGMVPPVPLIEEPKVANGGRGFEGGGDGIVGMGDSVEADFGTLAGAESEHLEEGAAAASTATTTATSTERSFRRIESSGYDQIVDISHSYDNLCPHYSSYHGHQRPSRPPRRPRDVSWTAAALLFIPAGLILPHLYYTRGFVDRHNHKPCSVGLHGMPLLCTPCHGSWADAALSPAAHSVVTISTVVATLVSLALLRCLYLSPGGGEGDDARHVNVTRTLLLSSNLCFWLNPALAFAMWHWLPNARGGVVLPLGLIARDVWRVRRGGSALPVVHGGAPSSPMLRQHAQRASSFARSSRLGAAAGGLGSAVPSSSSSHDRKTFFRALAVAALDVLSRSLRRRSFVRVASVLLLLQFLCVMLWWEAVSAVLSVKVFYEDGFVTKFMHAFWLLLALAAGKWATGTLARLLGFVAAGGVASWFGRQATFVERIEREAKEEDELRQQQQRQQQQQQQQNGQSSSSSNTLESPSDPDDTPTEDSSSHADESMSDDPAAGYAPGHATARTALQAMPEAYRTADASAYAPTLEFDEGLDDHYDEDFEDIDRGGGGTYSSVHASSSSLNSGQQHPSTVKSFLAAGCTFSFGSVAQCGLLGGPAQFLWSCVRNVDGAAFLLQGRGWRRGGGDSSSFRGMDIAVDGGGGSAHTWREAAAHWWRRTDSAVRGFVRAHSDLAMSHVAAYYKSYQRAANDVAVIIETSAYFFFPNAGVESIIHDDITTHMCSSVGHLVAGSTASVFGVMLVAHQNSSFAPPSSTLADNDASLLEVLLFLYVLCYTILFTALEPLRAAIKAVYVSFAEHPSSLSQAFPLIYQRLSRISEVR